MKHLKEYCIYCFEELSNNNIKELKKYINDNNFNIILPDIIQICKKSNLIGDNFKNYFKEKGLSKDFYDNNDEAKLGHRIASYFADYDYNNILIDIINSNKDKDHRGILNYETLYKASEYQKFNLYKLCYSQLNNKENINFDTFKKILEKIANINNVTANNANVGKFEILLKFILKENAVKHSHGDVAIDYNNGFGLEVKGGNTLESGARICGQTTRSTKELCIEFCKLLNIKDPKDISFLGSAKANTRLEAILDIYNIDKIIEAYVKAFAYQYQIDNKDDIEFCINKIKEYNKSENIFTIENNFIKIKSLTNLNGIIQLYFYSKKDQWDAIFVVNQTNGDYVIIDSKNILNIKDTLNLVKFYPFEGNEQATGRRCVSRIFPK